MNVAAAQRVYRSVEHHLEDKLGVLLSYVVVSNKLSQQF